jgi:mannose-6-phosphate isomerase-like protein (cupin superfamily)
MGHSFSSVDELGEGYGFRKVRRPLGVTAFGVNAIVMPPRFEGFLHYHDLQDELYFVHSGTARVEVEGEERLLGAGGLFHCESTTPRRVSNGGDDDLVLLVVGGKDGYVERDGQLVDMEKDLPRRQAFGA